MDSGSSSRWGRVHWFKNLRQTAAPAAPLSSTPPQVPPGHRSPWPSPRREPAGWAGLQPCPGSSPLGRGPGSQGSHRGTPGRPVPTLRVLHPSPRGPNATRSKFPHDLSGCGTWRHSWPEASWAPLSSLRPSPPGLAGNWYHARPPGCVHCSPSLWHHRPPVQP